MGRLKRFWLGDVDLAPLCLFRVVYGALLFNWIWQLWPNIPAFFTDEGMLPRPTLLSLWPSHFSLLFLTGDAWGPWLLWTIGLGVAVMLTIGFHTRLASFAAFVILISFMNRNPFMLDASDLVYRMVAFWLTFTDAGSRYAVDAWLRGRRGEPPKSFGRALPVRLLELQIGWIYLAAGLTKLEGGTWVDGTAAYFALQLEHTVGRAYAGPLAHNFVFVHWTTWATLAIELAFCPLVFAPFRQRYTRLIAVSCAAALHLGILVLMNVGNFPLIMLAALIPFCPGSLVEGLTARISGFFIHRQGRMGLATQIALSPVGSVQLPLFTPLSAAEQARVGIRATLIQREYAALPAAAKRLGNAAALVLLACVAGVAFATALPERFQAYRPQGALLGSFSFLSLDQNWGMFAPNPGGDDGWLVAPGVLADGSGIDLAAPGVAMDAPRFSDTFYSRWTKVNEWLSTNPPADYLVEYGRMYCRLRNWHLQPGQSALARFDLIYVDRIIPPPGQPSPPIQRRLLWSHAC